MQSNLFEYDIISLNEGNISLPDAVPSYLAFRSNVNRSTEHGGTAVLMKNYLAKYIVRVQTDVSMFGFSFCVYLSVCLVSVTYLLQIRNIVLTTFLL